MKQTMYRTVIVGAGHITRFMLKELTKLDWFQPVGLVDVRQEALTETGNLARLGAETQFTDLGKALDTLKPDLVLVNTPPRFHYEITKAALQAGAHALVAKPLASNFQEAADLVRIADVNGLKLTVGQQIRYNRHYQAVKRFVESGKLGTVESINFANAKHRPNMAECTMDQPCLYEMSCHHFDSLLDAIPDYVPDRIFCDGFQPSWSPYNGPCMVNATIAFKHETLPPLHIGYHAGFSSQSHNYEYRLEGSLGVLRCRGFHMSNDTMAYEFAERGKNLEAIDADAGIALNDPFGLYFAAWIDYMQGGAEPPFSGRNNLKTFALLCAGEESINSGQPVKVKDHPVYSGAFQ